MQERQQIGVLLIATRKYKQFVSSLVEDINKYFLLNHNVTIFLFTDEFREYKETDRVGIEQILIPDRKYPEVTLFRYRTFSNYRFRLADMDYLYYLDVDYSIVSEVTDEILVPKLMAVAHPGFYVNNGWGDSNNPKESTSYLPVEKRMKYACGGTQGGRATDYLIACVLLSVNIDQDEKNGVRAEWADETHWNHYVHTNGLHVTMFDSRYCMPEPDRLRQAWGLTELKPIILALDKDHKSIRE